MSETSFSQVNTAISVQEASFLTPQQYDQLLQADDPASRSALLQGTVYAWMLKRSRISMPLSKY